MAVHSYIGSGEEPLISVIIPTYNRAALLPRAVKSVLDQTHRNIEVIVVDDCSTDSTDEVVKSIVDERLKYVRLERNSGGSAARNKGVEIAQGEYIAFLDSDDEWLPQKLERQLAVFRAGPKDLGLVYCGLDWIGGIDDGHQAWPRARGRVFRKQLFDDHILGTPTWLIRRSCLHDPRVGLFDEDMPSRQDYDMSLRIARVYRVDYVDEIMVHVYFDSENRTTDDLAGRIEGSLRVLEKIEGMLDSGSPITRRRVMSSHYFWISWFLNLYGAYDDSLIYLKKAIAAWPLNAKALGMFFLISIGDRRLSLSKKLMDAKRYLLSLIRKIRD